MPPLRGSLIGRFKYYNNVNPSGLLFCLTPKGCNGYSNKCIAVTNPKGVTQVINIYL